MTTFLILGGSGAVGRTVTHVLALSKEAEKVFVGDINIDVAKKIFADYSNVSYIKLDVSDVNSLANAMKNVDIVVNCVGPFYKYAPIILDTAIKCRVNYVDICDDYDATLELLSYDNKAKKAGITALIGMGSSPGVANIIVKWAATMLLDEVHAVDIYHAHGGEEYEGAAVIKHRIHSMLIDIPIYINGKFRYVKLFSEEAKMYEEIVDFYEVGIYNVYLYPHPETITLPKYIKGLRRVTNKGIVLPPEYAELIKNVVRSGMIDEDPIIVNGTEIKPIDFAVAYIMRERKRILEKTGFTEPKGCLKVVINGIMNDEPTKYVFIMISRGGAKGKGMNEGTGIPAAVGALMITNNIVSKEGVFPPEAVIDPMKFLEIINEKIESLGLKKGGSPLIIERIDKDGNVSRMEL